MIKKMTTTPYYISDKLNPACKEYNRFYEMSEKSNHQDISTNSVLSMCYQVLQEEVENCLFQNDICENEVLYQALSKFCKNTSTSIKSRMNCNGWWF